jgi:hypothetical protein
MQVARSYPTRPASVEATHAGAATQDQAKLIVGFLPERDRRRTSSTQLRPVAP